MTPFEELQDRAVTSRQGWALVLKACAEPNLLSHVTMTFPDGCEFNLDLTIRLERANGQ